MLLSNTCIYGLRASVLLASKDGKKFVTIRELSNELHISFHFLTKVLQQLTKSELLTSYKGPNGGVKLARPASEITFMDIVVSIDGKNIIKECALGLPGCGEIASCPLHDEWVAMKESILKMMHNVSLEQLALSKNPGQANVLADLKSLNA